MATTPLAVACTLLAIWRMSILKAQALTFWLGLFPVYFIPSSRMEGELTNLPLAVLRAVLTYQRANIELICSLCIFWRSKVGA